MKAKLFTLSLATISAIAWGQGTSVPKIESGKIYYEEKVKLEIKIEGAESQYSDMLPKERKSEKVLSFTADATLFEKAKDISEDMTQGQADGVHIRMITSGDNKIYTDLRDKKITEQREFMDRIFRVEREFPEADWKITGNQKVILGYPCMEAVKTDTSGVRTVVWFAPAFDIKGGPAGFCNLPGMVLEADVKDGSHTYLAKSVEPVDPGALKIKKPVEGKRVTEAEYHKIVEEKMKEMGVEDGQGGDGTHMRIIIRN